MKIIMSLLKLFPFSYHSEHGFAQAPLEEITGDEYEKLKSKTKPIKNVDFQEIDIDESQIGCTGGVCPIK